MQATHWRMRWNGWDSGGSKLWWGACLDSLGWVLVYLHRTRTENGTRTRDKWVVWNSMEVSHNTWTRPRAETYCPPLPHFPLLLSPSRFPLSVNTPLNSHWTLFQFAQPGRKLTHSCTIHQWFRGNCKVRRLVVL